MSVLTVAKLKCYQCEADTGRLHDPQKSVYANSIAYYWVRVVVTDDV